MNSGDHLACSFSCTAANSTRRESRVGKCRLKSADPRFLTFLVCKLPKLAAKVSKTLTIRRMSANAIASSDPRPAYEGASPSSRAVAAFGWIAKAPNAAEAFSLAGTPSHCQLFANRTAMSRSCTSGFTIPRRVSCAALSFLLRTESVSAAAPASPRNVANAVANTVDAPSDSTQGNHGALTNKPRRHPEKNVAMGLGCRNTQAVALLNFTVSPSWIQAPRF
jgi:hypothetical protein